ncbi:hypothetical protein THTE_0780 [Thermogutta terrifontis]|uniref:Uncharacterized protein n=1 Tax=Thermogutta terrifontis TaxID=1331910 RepID=A0A286RBN8_9BACT|nr:hypothetical protein THTE_0780 [Thermogutta terrifontis]
MKRTVREQDSKERDVIRKHNARKLKRHRQGFFATIDEF